MSRTRTLRDEPPDSPRIYDVVEEGNDLESLIARLAAAPHRIVDNRSVDREEN